MKKLLILMIALLAHHQAMFGGDIIYIVNKLKETVTITNPKTKKDQALAPEAYITADYKETCHTRGSDKAKICDAVPQSIKIQTSNPTAPTAYTYNWPGVYELLEVDCNAEQNQRKKGLTGGKSTGKEYKPCIVLQRLLEDEGKKKYPALK
jgi:hypothetical protein